MLNHSRVAHETLTYLDECFEKQKGKIKEVPAFKIYIVHICTSQESDYLFCDNHKMNGRNYEVNAVE